MRHYQIHSLEVGVEGFFINLRLIFETIPALISHYSQQADGLCTNLKYPVAIPKPQHDPWEIDSNTIQTTKLIETHQLCEVFIGLLNNTTPVAIHILKEDSMGATKQFFKEAELMKQLKHPNIIELFGVCTRVKPLCIVTEFMNVGNLETYLKSKENCLEQSQLIDIGIQIASGMAYLASKNCVHRNLHAKNILLQEGLTEKLVCKVANFSFAQIVESYSVKCAPGEKYPIKWTAPEALRSGYFTTKSDVWSFGIVLYEIITFGLIPYPDILTSEVLSKLEIGYRMPRPVNCSENLYKIMEECWRQEAKARPTFEILQWKLREFYYSNKLDV